MGDSGEGELCTSLNPEEVVAEGLAIRGAVLSGVSSGKLRDLLVMDCLANSIGVMSWEAAADAAKEGSYL
jgi:L1 cell adhesion molecule like protein